MAVCCSCCHGGGELEEQGNRHPAYRFKVFLLMQFYPVGCFAQIVFSGSSLLTFATIGSDEMQLGVIFRKKRTPKKLASNSCQRPCLCFSVKLQWLFVLKKLLFQFLNKYQSRNLLDATARNLNLHVRYEQTSPPLLCLHNTWMVALTGEIRKRHS